MFVILLGAPGSGKGTQSGVLAKRLNLAHIATGDMFRDEVQRKTELGALARAYMDKGQLVPDGITISMLIQRMDSLPAACQGVLLDGFPRTIEQARRLDEALASRGMMVDRAILIDVAQGELLSRLARRWTCRSCGAVYHEVSQPPRRAGACNLCGGGLYQREDDREETVKQRLEVYFSQTAPVIEFYREQGKLAEVDGQGEIREVSESLLSALGVSSTQ